MSAACKLFQVEQKCLPFPKFYVFLFFLIDTIISRTNFPISILICFSKTQSNQNSLWHILYLCLSFLYRKFNIISNKNKSTPPWHVPNVFVYISNDTLRAIPLRCKHSELYWPLTPAPLTIHLHVSLSLYTFSASSTSIDLGGPVL